MERRISPWTRVVAAFVAGVMLLGTAAFLVDQVVNRAQLHEPAEIRTDAAERVAQSRWGWLVTDIVVVPIAEPRVGGRVTNSPADGIIQIDLRAWNENRLDRLIDHEIGHLLDFAVWGDGEPNRRGGLESEAWAECASVAAKTRRTDGERADERYRCTTDQLEIYEKTVASFTEVCRRWGEPECRSVN